jgi:hypothetical protein
MDELTQLSGPLIEGFALGLLLLLLMKGGEKHYVVSNFRQLTDLRPLGWFQLPIFVTALFIAIWLALAVTGFLLPWSNSKMDNLMLFLGAIPGGGFAYLIWSFYLRGR